jgi:non-heme chloroperoxidase
MPSFSSQGPVPSRRIKEYTVAGGLTLTADVWGDESMPPVLLLHGGGQTRNAWGGTAEALARAGFYAVSLDMRGHGDSDWHEEGDYSIEGYAGDLGEIVGQLDDPPLVVGASLGGLAALLLEGELEPGVVKAIVFVDITPRMENEGVERILEFMSAYPEGFESIEQAADAVAEFIPHRPRPSDHAGLAKNLRLGEDGRYRWHWDPRFITGRIERKTERAQEEFARRLARAARAIKIPALLVRGRMSDIVSEKGAREFLNMVPHAEYIDVADAAHMVASDKNDIFTEAVSEFLLRTEKG